MIRRQAVKPTSKLFVDRIGQRYYVPEAQIHAFKTYLDSSIYWADQMEQHRLEHVFGRYVVDSQDMVHMGISNAPVNKQGIKFFE